MGKPQVTLTLAGDHSQLTKSFEEVGASSKEMADTVDSSSKEIKGSFDSVGGGIDETGSKAGDLESGFRGITDSMSGFSQIAQGDVLGGLTDLAGGAEALAMGFSGVVVPALQKTIGWLAQTRVGILAQAVAQKVAAAGARVWAATQWLLNAALSANPIGLVILAIVALGAVFVIVWKKSETFRNFVTRAFKGVLRIVSAVWGWIKKNWPTLLAILTGPIGLAVIVIRKYGNRIWGFFRALPRRIRGAFSGLASILTAPFRQAFAGIRNYWNSTIGGRGFTIPSWVPQIGGRSFSIPRFHTGGIMPGAPGTEGLALLQAGERVTPANRSNGPTVIEIRSGGSRLDDLLVEVLRKSIRDRGGNVQVVLGKG